MYLCGVNAAKAIKQETLNKHCSPFAISVNIKNDKSIQYEKQTIISDPRLALHHGAGSVGASQLG